ncbi:hypothetical protein [Flavobacterium beibuense]|uniref:hypothetical protein n=1 Tax=Flavobacterium beibuense TaxID=657326 RepID=UPI003A9068EA
MRETTNKYLISALLIGVVFHASLMFFTLENTYDALIHLFFANHYAHNWFESWNTSWYTGFTVMGYPPLVHQAIGLFSLIGGLKFGLFAVTIICVILFITGVYRFTLLLTGNRTVAGYASLIAVFSSSFLETLHIFGQLPSIMGISILMHSLPEIYLWVKTGRKRYLLTSLSLIAVTVTSHHVTPIFGMVFFILPLIGVAVMDMTRERTDSYSSITFRLFIATLISSLKRIVVFGIGLLTLVVVCILPYWVNSRKNPITQVPIPHGSRDNFLEVTSSGLMFFLIPWGIILFILPYVFYRYFSKRYIFFGLSLSMLAILGTGGTTPIPLKLLGTNAFNILTLDRFTLWASIVSLPMFGEFVYRLVEGDLKQSLQLRYGTVYHRIISGVFAGAFLGFALFTISLGYFRPFQPQKINMLPIVNFLNQDQHDRWRFLPLGFGDQMAYLSTQTGAMTVDGNYHSARRLPELTSRAVERLENSKFRGMEGIGSLQQFLTVPEKYNLKYVFSNDKFYDPILYFSGWQRLNQLENGIMVWEKLNVPPMPKVIPKEEAPLPLRLMWGIIPLLTVVLAFVINIQMLWIHALKTRKIPKPDFFLHAKDYTGFSKSMLRVNRFWVLFMVVISSYGLYKLYYGISPQISPDNVVKSYYDALDFKEFERAYSYITPNDDYPLSQYLLEISVTDGIVNSYAKLDAITVNVTDKTKNSAGVKVKTKWVTPLEVIDREYVHRLVKKKGKWYIVPDKKDPDIPPDQIFADNTPQFYKHGRRRITTQQTYHEDVLKQPELEILSARMIFQDNKYMIVGELQNIDNIPADVAVKATLYDEKDKRLATHNAKYVIKHKLMPKETTTFKVNFEDIAWQSNGEVKPETFNPDEFTPAKLKSVPVNFDIQSAGNVATTDLYKEVALNDLNIDNTTVQGTLFNYGIQEVTIPELLVGYYNDEKEIIYTDHFFIREGIRVQRKQRFRYKLIDLSKLILLKSGTENCYVNGLPNEEMARKTVPLRIDGHNDKELISVNGKGYSYIKIEINNYIANPR